MSTVTETSTTETNSTDRSDSTDTINKNDLPHRIKNDSPKDDRSSLNMYVSGDDQQRIRDLEGLANREFEENVHLIDVYLAALRSDFYDDDSFIEEMVKIGYGFFD